MREFISQPGIQFYVYQLQGSLSYNVTLPKKPTRQFELREDDFDSFSSERECEIGHHVPGTDASAIGLKLKLVRNDGLLQVRYEGRDGGTAKWTFNGLQETSRQSAMYASAGSQTSIMTFDLKPTQKNPESLLDAKTDAFLRERKIDIESVLGKEKDGTIWQISHGGAAKRIFDEDVEVTEPIAVEPPTVARRVSNRNRVEKTLPYAAFESLPRCIYLPGQTKIQGGDYVNGALMLDQAHFSVAFETTREIMQTEIDSDVSNEVQWKPYLDYHQLRIFTGGDLRFTSYHRPLQLDQIVGRDKYFGEYTHRIRLDDFLGRLKTCLISENMTVNKKKKKNILKRRRTVNDSEEECI